jgi:Protein of unknown function (DUF3040)
MSLPASEERVLSRIETALLDRDPRLRSLFAIFTRLTRQEAMPATEQLRRRRRWSPQQAVVVLLAGAILIGVILAGAFGPAGTCGPARTAASSASSAPSAVAASALIPGCSARQGAASRTP